MKPTRFELVILLLFASIVIYTDFVPPVVGMADSGDFERFFAQTGLFYVETTYEDRYFNFLNLKYRIISKSPEDEPYRSSSAIPIRAARWLSIQAGEKDFFDIRVLGVLWLAVFLVGIWLILAAARSLSLLTRIVLAGSLLIFSDVGYVAYFNSLYSEAAGLCFLAIGIASALKLTTRASSSLAWLIAYFCSAAVVVTAKPQYTPLALLLGLFGIYVAFLRRARREVWLAISLSVALCGLATWYYRQTPIPLRMQVAYLGVFTDLLPNSPTPADDLVELGLDPGYAAFSGTNPYQEHSPFKDPTVYAEFSGNMTPHSLPWFYVTHPVRLYDLCQRCVKHAFKNRIARLGYYEAKTGNPPQTQGKGVWCDIQENLFPRTLPFVGLFIATAIPALAMMLKARSRQLAALSGIYVLLVSIAVVQFFVASFAQGEMDLEKHLFMFNVAFNACLVLAAVGCAHFLQEYVRNWTLRSKAAAVADTHG
jgi:hypothetical protein